jgi:uncharacterized membrane protein YphA (DoxX/SURF4 family)
MTLKTKNIIIWIIAVVVAAIFIYVGIAKLAGSESMVRKLEGWGFPLWTRFPIGIAEIGLGIPLLIPKARKVTVYLILIWGILAVITYFQAGQFIQALLPVLLALLAGVILPLSKQKQAAT